MRVWNDKFPLNLFLTLVDSAVGTPKQALHNGRSAVVVQAELLRVQELKLLTGYW